MFIISLYANAMRDVYHFATAFSTGFLQLQKKKKEKHFRNRLHKTNSKKQHGFSVYNFSQNIPATLCVGDTSDVLILDI